MFGDQLFELEERLKKSAQARFLVEFTLLRLAAVKPVVPIDEIMERGGRRRRKVKRRFTAVAWMYRKLNASGSRGHQRRRGFNLESPEDR